MVRRWDANVPSLLTRNARGGGKGRGGGNGPPGGGGGTDPQFANVVALFHFDDVAGSTSFVDRSANNNPMIGVAASVTSAAQSVFGGLSCAMTNDGTKARTSSLAAYQMGVSDFTIEFRFRPAELVSTRFIFAMDSPGAVGNVAATPQFFLWADGKFTYRGGTADMDSPVGTLVVNTWSAIAYERAAGVGRLYHNGVVLATAADVVNYNVAALVGIMPAIVAPGTSYIDELRITKVARYAGAYTIATSAFPNS